MDSALLQSARELEDLEYKIMAKYGVNSCEHQIFHYGILDLNRELVSKLRNESRPHERAKFSLVTRVKSAALFLIGYSKALFLSRYDCIFFPSNDTHFVQHIPVAERLLNEGYTVLVVTNKLRLFHRIPRSVPKVFIPLNLNPFFRRAKIISVDDCATGLECLVRVQMKASLLTVFLRIIARRTSPKVVFLGNDISTEGKVAEREFRKIGAQIFCIQHGGMNNPLYKFSTVDLYFVFGEYSRRLLKNFGFPEKKVVVSGPPYLNAISKGGTSIDAFLSGLKKDQTFRKICLILLSGVGHSTSKKNNDQIFSVIQRIAARNPHVLFIFKLHVKDRIENYKHLIDKKIPIVFVNNSNLNGFGLTVFDLIASASCVFSGASSSVLEAMYFLKPVFTFDFEQEYTGIDFMQAHVTVHFDNEVNALHTMDKFFADELDVSESLDRARKFIGDYFSINGITPARAIIEIISQR